MWPAMTCLSKNSQKVNSVPTSVSIWVTLVTSLMNILKNGPCCEVTHNEEVMVHFVCDFHELISVISFLRLSLSLSRPTLPTAVTAMPWRAHRAWRTSCMLSLCQRKENMTCLETIWKGPGRQSLYAKFICSFESLEKVWSFGEPFLDLENYREKRILLNRFNQKQSVILWVSHTRRITLQKTNCTVSRFIWEGDRENVHTCFYWVVALALIHIYFLFYIYK